ncbi:MAG: hypothetical protein RSE22_06645, partial [Mucinivorans sp.]
TNGTNGADGLTPYIWVNNAGNWASNLGSKPIDSDNVKYELKVDGKSVKVNGASTRVVNKDGFVAFEEYDMLTNTVLNTVTTNFPFNGGKIVTAIVETEESVTFTIENKDYRLAKAAVYPTSITVIRDKDYVIKGGTVELDIAVNPANSKVYTKDNFELDFEKSFSRAYGNKPAFIKIKDVQPNAAIKGQYKMTLEWTDAADGFVKDAAIFIVLNCTDVEGNQTQIISSTPVIMNEKYVSIKAENVLALNDIVMFTDETYTDSVRLNQYHQGYVNTVDYALVANPIAINPLTRYLTPDGDKYKFTVIPIEATNTTVWPTGVSVRKVNVDASVADFGRAAVPTTPAKPEIGQPAIQGIPAIPAVTVKKGFMVTVHKVPADAVIHQEYFGDRWLPNTTVDYQLAKTLNVVFDNNGYNTSEWNFVIKDQELQMFKNASWTTTPMTNKITANVTKFDLANNFAVSYKLLPTIDPGQYQVLMTVTATAKKARAAELKQVREFKVKFIVNVVAPKFQIYYNGAHSLIGAGSDTYETNVLTDVKVDYLFDIESTKNISTALDVSPNASPLAYDYDLTDPRHGAQGIRFNPYPAVSAPAVEDWKSELFIKKPITANVKLATGQLIPVVILCTQANEVHSVNSTLYVQYTRLNLASVDAVNEKFVGNYNAMVLRGVSIADNANFTPKALNNKTLDKTTIKSVVFSAQGTVQSSGALPSGLAGKQIMKIDAATGNVTSIDGISWENPEAVLFQVFRVTYTDIWGNSAFHDVNVYVKSNSLPVLP